MKIAKVVAKSLVWDLDSTLSNPRFTWTRKEIVLVFVETDDGLTGVGEGWTSGGTADALVATLEKDVAPRLVGRDPRLISAIWDDLDGMRDISARRGLMKAAMSAVDIALWDILGQHVGLPLYQLLGAYSDSAYVYASAGLYAKNKTAADLANEMFGYIEQGFEAVKMKVGGAPLDFDVERVEAARGAIGAGRRLMVDAVCAMTPHAALALAERIRVFDVYWFEQPVPAHDIDGMALVNERSGISVAGNENFVDLYEFHELLMRRAATFLQFDLVVAGGVTEGMRLGALARAWHKSVTIHHASSVVGMVASLHVAAALPNCDSVEFHQLHSWMFDRTPEGYFKVDKSRVQLTDRPGLGLDLRPDSV